MVRAPEGSVCRGEMDLKGRRRKGQKNSLEGFQGCEHRELRWKMRNWTCRCDREHRKHREGAAQSEQDQPLAQSHTAAMQRQKIEIFNSANCSIYFVEVPLNITTFFPLVLELPEQIIQGFCTQHHELCSSRSRTKYRY